MSAPLRTLLYLPATNHPPQHASRRLSRMLPYTAQYTMLIPYGRDTVRCLYGVMNSLTSMGKHIPPPMLLLLCRFCSTLVSYFKRCGTNLE